MKKIYQQPIARRREIGQTNTLLTISFAGDAKTGSATVSHTEEVDASTAFSKRNFWSEEDAE